MKKILLFLSVLFAFAGLQAQVTVTSVTPDPEKKVRDVGTVVFEFSDNVASIVSASVKFGWNFRAINLDTNAKLEGNKITLDIAYLAEELKNQSTFRVMMTVKDNAGNQIKYGPLDGLVTVDYIVDSGKNTFELVSADPADKASVQKLKSVILTYGKAGLGLAGIDAGKNKINLKDANGEVVATGDVKYLDSKDIYVLFPEAVTKPGKYTLTIPEALVYDETAIISDYTTHYVSVNDPRTANSTYNPEVTLTYYIDGPDPATVVSVTPEADTELEEVQNIDIVFSYPVTVESCNLKLPNNEFITLTEAEMQMTYDRLTLNLDAYKNKLSSVSQFAVLLQAKDDTGGYIQYGAVPDYITLNYTLKNTGNDRAKMELLESDPADGATVETLSRIMLTYGSNQLGIYANGIDQAKEKGEIINKETGEVVTTVKFISVSLTAVSAMLAKEINEPGTYTMTVPEGLVWDQNAQIKDWVNYYVDMNNLGDATCNKEVTLTFHIEGASGPATVETVTPASGTELPQIGDIVIKFTDMVTADYGALKVGPTEIINLEPSEMVVDGKKLTVNLSAYEDILIEKGEFVLLLNVYDAAGNPITYGELPDFIMLQYTVNVPSAGDRATMQLISSDPANGSTVDVLKRITLTYGDYNTGVVVTGIDQAKEMTTVVNKNTGEKVADAKFVSMSSTQVACILLEEISTPGTYTITVPEGLAWDQNAQLRDWMNYYVDMDKLGDATCNPEITLTFIVEAAGERTALESVDPASGSMVDEVEDITLTFTGKITAESAILNLGVDGTYELEPSEMIVNNNVLTLSMGAYKEMLTEIGSYFILVYVKDEVGNYITNNESTSECIILQYTLATPQDRNTLLMVSSDPVNGDTVNSLSRVTMKFANPDDPFITVGGIDGAKESVSVINQATGDAVAKGKFVFMMMNEVACILTEELTEPGTYIITVPEGLVWDSTAEIYDMMNYYVDMDHEKTKKATYNPQIVFTITVTGGSGIDSIEQGQTEVEVYSVQGLFIGKGTAAEILPNLEKGVYIVNGEKMYITK